MRMSRLVGRRTKEQPADATLASHIFLLRGGYIRPVANGICSLLPPARRIAAKIEAIVREEMDALGGQEVLMPVVMPRELWDESGRYQGVGPELVRFQDRTGHDMLLGMTHEEAAAHLCRNSVTSHLQLPFMTYQIQTKFRDEAKSRGGLIRAREFTMKDAYSFHASQEDLDRFYAECLSAYERIFNRAGLPEVVAAQSDTGMMGRAVAHEFMLLCDAGEDKIIVCDNCDYKANQEVATCEFTPGGEEESAIGELDTPNVRTIQDLSGFLNLPAARIAKSVVMEVEGEATPTLLLIRGDLEVNELKLARLFRAPFRPASEESIAAFGSVAGFVGPVGLDPARVRILADRSIVQERRLVCGANRVDLHLDGFRFSRDCPGVAVVDVAQVPEGATCPRCRRGALQLKRGIEVGKIRQLGTKYTEAMGMTVTTAEGKQVVPVMGCYGIGVGRLIAAVLEARHDEYGPVWPRSIAPWDVHVCALQMNKPGVREAAERVNAALERNGYDVLFDDRDQSPGVQFADADLLGVPFRVVVSPRGLAEGNLELRSRDKSLREMVSLEAFLQHPGQHLRLPE